MPGQVQLLMDQRDAELFRRPDAPQTNRPTIDFNDARVRCVHAGQECA